MSRLEVLEAAEAFLAKAGEIPDEDVEDEIPLGEWWSDDRDTPTVGDLRRLRDSVMASRRE